MNTQARIPATIVSGFLGAGKTSLVRHVLENAGGRRIAVIVNEFGQLGIDGATLRDCAIPGCAEGDIVELANGCLCCTVADEFLPAMQALLDRAEPPEHILIETSGLALPKPLIKAFDWPDIRARVTVDGVVTLIDAPAYADGRFADDPDAVAAARAADPTLDHDNPLAEVFDDQLASADLVVLNKADLAPADELASRLAAALRPGVRVVTASHGRVPLAALLGIGAAAEDDLASRPSHHDAEDGAHEHDDFFSFVAPLDETAGPDPLLARITQAVRAHDILRVKGFCTVAGKRSLLAIEGVGPRVRAEYGRPLRADDARGGKLVVIGKRGLDADAVARALAG
jgi:cobalamin biosynthesis protein CobW